MLSTIIVLLVDIYPDEERGDFAFIEDREQWVQIRHYQEPLHATHFVVKNANVPSGKHFDMQVNDYVDNKRDEGFH